MSQHTVICHSGIDCKHDMPGHALTFMAQRMAHISRAQYVDAVVVEFDGDWAVLQDVADEEFFLIWNHEDLRSVVEPGEMVSVSTEYSLLSVGEQRYSVAVLKTLDVELDPSHFL